MASRLMWAGGLLAAFVLLALWLQPREPTPEPEPGLAGEIRAQNRLRLELLDQVRRENQLLQQHIRADSVRRALPDRPGVRVALPPMLRDTEIEDRLLAALQAELEATGPPQVRLAFLVVPRGFGLPEATDGTMWRFGPGSSVYDLVYLGRDERGPYCAVVAVPHFRHVPEGSDRARTSPAPPSPEDSLVAVELPGFDDRRFRPPLSMLGACAFMARYGPPGPEVEGWLIEGGGGIFGESMEPPPSLDPGEVFGRLVFGIQLGRDFRIPSVGAACQAGRSEACQALFLRPALPTPSVPRSVAHPRFVELNYWRAWPPFPGTNDLGLYGLLAELEETFGSDRFARFWSADQDVLTAFSTAFGLPAEEWMAEWVQGRYGSEPRGPRVPPGTLLLSLLTMAGLVGCSLFLGARRSVA